MTSTSNCSSASARKEGLEAGNWGFSLIELLLALALTLCLALAVAPVWASVQSRSVRDGDGVISLLQGRVAASRMERDLRLASAMSCPFKVDGPILQGSASQVVFLTTGSPGEPPAIVEWEVTGGALMRRKGACPATRPTAFPHSLYSDNKTMLEGIIAGASFGYSVGGVDAGAPVAPEDLSLVDLVALKVQHAVPWDRNGVVSDLLVRASVGR